jgi:hypothetical protein
MSPSGLNLCLQAVSPWLKEFSLLSDSIDDEVLGLLESRPENTLCPHLETLAIYDDVAKSPDALARVVRSRVDAPPSAKVSRIKVLETIYDSLQVPALLSLREEAQLLVILYVSSEDWTRHYLEGEGSEEAVEAKFKKLLEEGLTWNPLPEDTDPHKE